MTKSLFYTFCILIAVCSCAKIEQSVSETGITEITFTGEKPQIEGLTKTEFKNNTIVWSKTDNISATYYNKSGASWVGKVYKSTSNPTFSDDYSKAKFKISGNFDKLKADNEVNFYTYYPPFSEAQSVDGDKVKVSIPSSQTPSSSSFDASGDLLLGTSGDVTVPASTSFSSLNVSITWSRLVAHGYITFKKLSLESGEVVKYVKITSDQNMAGSFTLNSETGALTASSPVKTITVNANSDNNNLVLDADGYLNVWFCSLPFNPSTLTVEVFTDNALYTKTFSGLTGKTFVVNKRNILAVNMSSATKIPLCTYQRLTSVDTGGSYLFVCEEKNKVFTGQASSNSVDIDANYSSLGNGTLSTYQDLSSYHLTISAVESSTDYHIRNADNNNIGFTGSSSEGIKVSSNNYTNNITFYDGLVTIKSIHTSGSYDCILNLPTGKSNFYYTKDATSNVSIYKLN